MLELRKFLIAGLGISTLVLANIQTANASYLDGAEFSANGANTSAFETKLGPLVQQKSVQDLGFSIYQQGRTFPGSTGAEIVSSSPDIDFVNKHAAAYCSPGITVEATGPMQCKPMSGSNIDPNDAKLVELGDVNFSILLEPTVYSGLGDLTAQNLIRTITNPFPTSKYKDMVKSKTFLDDGNKKKQYAKYMANQAVLGVAMYSMNEMYGMRVSGKSLGFTDDKQKNTSLMAIMEDEATRRYEQPDFAAFLAAATDPATAQLAVLKEIAAMEAFKLWMDYQRYKQGERIEALLAASLAKSVAPMLGQ